MVYAPPIPSPSQPTFSELPFNRLKYERTRVWQQLEEGNKQLNRAPERAKKHFNKAISFATNMSKEDAALLANSIGAELGKRKLYNEALTFIQRAIELDPNLLGAHNNLGVLLDEQKRYD